MRTASRQRAEQRGILASSGLQLVDLFGWRQLIFDMARAELRRENRRLVLGDLWWVADPLLQMIVYTILVTVLFERGLPDYPIFVLPALMAWKGFSASVSSCGTAITGNERIVRQLTFPRIVLPVARAASQLWRLGVALVVLVVLMALVWPERLSLALVWLPLLAVVQVVFLLPFAIALSAATVFLRDLTNLMRHVMRLGLYLSPVLYGLDQFAERAPASVAAAYAFNPVALLLEAYRDVAYRGDAPSAASLLLPVGVGLILLPLSLAWFRGVEPRFGKAL